MKIDQIINEMTSSGAVASVSMPLGATQKRAKESVDVKGLKPVSKLKNAKKKGPYVNSIVENKEQVKVSEAELQEDDLIIIPGRGTKRKNGFVPKGQSRVDHEVEMARSDVLATMKNAKSIYHMLKNRSEEEGIEGWVQEKLIKANDYLNAVKEYYDEQMMQEMNGGVIAAGGVGEGVAEGLGKNLAKLGGMTAVGIGAGIGGSYLDSKHPKIEIGGQQAYLIKDPGWGKIPNTAMKLQGADGRTYIVWTSSGKGNRTLYATPAENVKEGVAEGSNDLYQKAIRKYAQQVANDYLNGGNEYLYGANKFDAEMFGVSQEKANKDFKTWFTMIVRSQAVRPRRGVAEGSESKISKCASLAAKYFNSEGLQRQYDIDEYIKNNAGNDPIVNKCASLAAKYFNSEGLQRQYDIDEYIKANAKQGVAEGYKEPTTAAGHAKMAAKIKKMLDDTLADRGDRHGNPDPQRLASAYEYHTQKAKEKSQGVAEGSLKEDEYDKYETGKMGQEEAVTAMFTRLARQGIDPIDMIANRFGWSTYELDDLAQQQGFENTAEWLNSFEQGVAEGSFSPQEYGKQLQTKINQDAINKALVLKKQKQNLGNRIIANTIQQQLAKKGVAASKDKSEKKS